MSDQWSWPGARWWKCDFHMHTPASYDFVNRDTVTAADWVAAARAAELDAVAITDHNTGTFVEQVKTASSDQGRQLVVFPGVELTVDGGLHLLIIFPPGRNGDAITTLLGECRMSDEHLGRPEALGKCTFEQALHIAQERGGLCIAAHVDDGKGLLKELVHVTTAADGAMSYRGSETLQRALRS
ncbi:MAG: hypothetical protein V2A73_12825, partial [Pseudomonadota bacterium]